jgi:hypothetical protein
VRVTAYNDEYPTCDRTYATLCLYSDDLEPEAISSLVGALPSTSAEKGGSLGTSTARRNTWLLTSEGAVESRDARRHIDWVLDRVDGPALSKLLMSTCEGWLSCFWASRSGHGGPMVSPQQMERLAALGLDLGFDCYLD